MNAKPWTDTELEQQRFHHRNQQGALSELYEYRARWLATLEAKNDLIRKLRGVLADLDTARVKAHDELAAAMREREAP